MWLIFPALWGGPQLFSEVQITFCPLWSRREMPLKNFYAASDFWLLTDYRKQSVLRDGYHHSNVCWFDFMFLCQGQNATCWRIRFYVHVYGHLDSSSSAWAMACHFHKEKPALPTTTPLCSYITLTERGGNVFISQHTLCVHAQDILFGDPCKFEVLKTAKAQGTGVTNQPHVQSVFIKMSVVTDT